MIVENKRTPTLLTRAVLQAAAGPQTALALVAAIPAERHAFVFRSLAWLVKLGVLKVIGR